MDITQGFIGFIIGLFCWYITERGNKMEKGNWDRDDCADILDTILTYMSENQLLQEIVLNYLSTEETEKMLTSIATDYDINLYDEDESEE
jgi:hypothetical protein